MRPGARAQAAIEILTDCRVQRRPAAESIKDWMGAHRFAGARDRAEIGDLVFAALRWANSSAWRLGAETPRAAVLGALRWGFAESTDAFAAMSTEPYGLEPLSESERVALETRASLEQAPAWVAGDYPSWLDAEFTRAFGAERIREGAALAAPAPLDLRANTLKTTRDALIEDLAQSPKLERAPQACPFAADGVRIPWRRGGSFPWATERAFQKGWFEVQDEGSQLAAALAGARGGLQVADVCAGGGGKTLALAAAMGNSGQIYAHDVSAQRLAALHERLQRSGARNVQIRPPRRHDVLEDLRGRMDVVLVDAPCSGSGTWRRAPETKWRLTDNALAKRLAEQQQALDLGWPLVRPGGLLFYVTCSVLPVENSDAVTTFLGRTPEAEPAPLVAPAPSWTVPLGLQFTPARTGTDGFFVAALRRAA